MNSLTYHIKGKTYTLTSEKFQQFNNNDTWNRVSINSEILFRLKSGKTITGIVEDIKFSYPVDGSDNPLQTKFSIKAANGDIFSLEFHEIESHSPAPIIKK